MKIEELNNKTEFLGMFEITRSIIFEVSFYTLGSNKEPRFTTSASCLNRPKSDYSLCGQAQESLLPTGSKALSFFTKWDQFHLANLKESQYDEMVQDLKELEKHYNSQFFKGSTQNIPFYKVVEFSRLPLKKLDKKKG